MIGTIPWDQVGPLSGWSFEEFRIKAQGVNTYQRWKSLATYLNGIGIMATATRLVGEPPLPLNLRQVDQTVHNDVFGGTALAVPAGGLRLDFYPHAWRLICYLGSDMFDDARFPALKCYAADGTFIGGDGPDPGQPTNMTTYGPENQLPSAEHPRARAFQYLVCCPSPYPLLNYIPRPIAYATITGGGTETFCGLIQVTL